MTYANRDADAAANELAEAVDVEAAIRQAKALNKETANNAPDLLAVDGICAGLEAVIAGWNDSRLNPVIEAMSDEAITAFNTWRRAQRESAEQSE